MRRLFYILIGSILLSFPLSAQESQGSWVKPDDAVVIENLSKWQDSKFGLMMHWGPYSQLGVVESWSICAEDDAFRNEGMITGAYFSKPDWNSEYFWWPKFSTPDRNANYNITKYPERWQKFVDFTHTQIDELCSNYGKLDILWFDGGWVNSLKPEELIFSVTMDGIFRQHGYTQLRVPQNQDLNHDAIYNTRGTEKFADGNIRFTQEKSGKVYAIYLVPEGEDIMPDFIVD